MFLIWDSVMIIFMQKYDPFLHSFFKLNKFTIAFKPKMTKTNFQREEVFHEKECS